MVALWAVSAACFGSVLFQTRRDRLVGAILFSFLVAFTGKPTMWWWRRAVIRSRALQPGQSIGLRAPDFVLRDVEGKVHRLEDSRTSKVILVFWRSWCTPCLAELPYLQEVFERHSDNGIVVLAVSDESESVRSGRHF